jgi:hypothetical protein
VLWRTDEIKAISKVITGCTKEGLRVQRIFIKVILFEGKI